MIQETQIRDFGEWLKNQRESRKMSKGKLARQIHCHYNSITRWETGCQFPPVDMAEQIVKVFGCELVIKEGAKNE